jgi:hypothetical protein
MTGIFLTPLFPAADVGAWDLEEIIETPAADAPIELRKLRLGISQDLRSNLFFSIVASSRAGSGQAHFVVN